jgi:hypothetical protein
MGTEGYTIFHACAATMTRMVHCDSGYRRREEARNGGQFDRFLQRPLSSPRLDIHQGEF